MLKKREKLIITTQNKIKIIFEIYFSLSSIMFMKNVKEYDYSLSVDDETSIIYCEIIKIIYKINLNKIFKINQIINKALRQFVCVLFKQIRSFFNKYIKKKI